jgi:threonine/homoserine/homoserine lactone efflux protein
MFILATTSAFTPGPNNAMVTASSVNFGFRRTIPHIMGIGIGFGLMVLIVGLFLGQIFQTYVILREALRWFGAALLIYVAYQIITSGGLGRSNGTPRPMTFIEAAGFQWINPKGWAMAIALTSQFVTPTAPYATALILGTTFVALGVVSAGTWAGFGVPLRRFLTNPTRLRAFNWVMGVTIAGCIILLFS